MTQFLLALIKKFNGQKQCFENTSIETTLVNKHAQDLRLVQNKESDPCMKYSLNLTPTRRAAWNHVPSYAPI